MKKKPIYTVTTLQFGFKYGNNKRSKDGVFHSFLKRTSPSQRKYFTITNKRTWGWYSKLEDAQKCVEENWADIYEGSYGYAVIEEVHEGILHGANTPREWWYKWQGSWEKGKYKPWNKPKEYDGIIFFMSRIRKLKAHWGDTNDD